MANIKKIKLPNSSVEHLIVDSTAIHSEDTVTSSKNGLMLATDKAKLDGIQSGAEANVQADWNTTDTTADSYIKNKPNITSVNDATLTIQKNGTAVATFTANSATDKVANITVPTKTSELTNDSGYTTNTGTVTSVAVKMNGSTKGTVTTSGTIDLGTVITAHQDISGKEDASNKVSAWSTTTTDDHYPSEKLVKSALDGKAASSHTHTASEVSGLATVATSGSYNDLTNKPTIDNNNQTVKVGTTTFGANDAVGFVAGSNITSIAANTTDKTITINAKDTTYSAATTSANGLMSSSDKTKLDGVTTGATKVASSSTNGNIKINDTETTVYTHPSSHAASMITGLATVATSGKYSDLSGTPTIPTVNNGTLTMQVAGTTKTTFTANQSGAATFNVTADDLGLSQALVFKGITTTDLTDGATTSPITMSDSSSLTPAIGNVVITASTVATNPNTEFVWASSKWNKLGDAKSYALSSVTVTGSGVLGGGGNLTTNRTITHNTSGATAGSYGDSSAQTPAYGGTFNVPYITVNDTGHVTGISAHTVKIPASDNTNQTVKGNGTAFGASAAVNFVPGSNVTITPDTTNNKITIASSYTDTNQTVKGAGTAFGSNAAVDIVAGSNVTVTPDATNNKITIAATDTVTTATTSGSGNAVTAITASGGALTVTKGTTFLTSHQDISGKANVSEAGYSLAVSGTSLSLKNKAGTVLNTVTTQDTDTKNTAGSTDTSSKIFLVGATSQAANPQTYSDNEIYATSGALTTKTVAVGGGSCTLQYADDAVKFVFA